MSSTLKIKIKKLLAEHSMTIKELCYKIGMTENGYHQMIRNDSIKVKTLQKIADAFNISIQHFFDNNSLENECTIGGIKVSDFASKVLEKAITNIAKNNIKSTSKLLGLSRRELCLMLEIKPIQIFIMPLISLWHKIFKKSTK